MVLDIIQDFLSLRDKTSIIGWKYERIDGNIRAEERFASITRFQASKSISINTRLSENDPWCFLLTTKAGGIGLNLTNSDTVIFLDGDWNPQNDLQALARCHRIGQDNKAKLTGVDIARLVKTNLGQLTEKTYEKFKLSDKELEEIIGRTDENGRWMNVSKENGPKNDRKKEVITNMFLDADEIDKVDTCSNDYTVFEGVCYRVTFKDEMEFEKLRFENDFKNIKRKRRAIVKEKVSKNQLIYKSYFFDKTQIKNYFNDYSSIIINVRLTEKLIRFTVNTVMLFF
uniref:Helicase C-terminal domain-containing protein n=1 Tax=Heterorhabditis bacteriophora TaxID=37862 RepID=A0A1I7WGC4_HETBA